MVFLGAGLIAPAWAQVPTGTILGRVFNPATGEYVRNAEVRIVGTEQVVATDNTGSFQFDRVPAGEVTLDVSYTGHSAAPQTFTVAEGQTVTREIALTSGAVRPAARAPGEEQPLRLGEFVVSGDREGNAKAIMEQKRSMNITTSVASDIFGDVAEGNIGEFLKYMPGVQIDYVEGVARGPKLGGLDSQYTQLTVDGGNFASADAFTAGGANSRSVSFEQLSINNIESIEISRTASADMDANAPGGRVNLKTKRAFDLKGRRISYQFSASANSEEFTLRRTYGPQHGKSHHVMPNYILGYSDVFLDQRLGLTFNLSSSKQYSEQLRVTDAYNTVATDPRPKVLQQLTFKDGPRVVQNFATSLTADYKLAPRLVLSLTGMFNAYLNNADARQLQFTTATNNTNATTGRGTVLGDGLTDVRTSDVGATTNTGHTVGFPGSGAQKLTNTLTLLPNFEYKAGPVTVEGRGGYSHSKNDYETIVRGIARSETLNTITANFRATRPSADSHEWTLTQLSGPDWSNLANYTNPRITEEGRFALTEIWSGQLDTTYKMPLRWPSSVKFGGKWEEETRTFQNLTGLYNWSYIGPGGNRITGYNATTSVPNLDGLGTWVGYQSPHVFDMGTTNALTIDRMLPVVDRNAIATLFREHPEQFVNIATPADYYSARVTNDRHMREEVDALYGMGNTRIGPWQFQGGVRWERTVTKSREVNPLSAAQVKAAGYPVDSTGRATTFPGVDYQFFSQPRTIRRGEYDYFFPSVSAKWNVRPNLVAQAGYSYTISRPSLTALAGSWSINDATQVISAPNPNLKPELSHNYMTRVAYYFEPVGQFSVTLSQNEISNASESRTLSAADAQAAGFAVDPAYSSYQITAPFNADGIVRYRAAELAYNQALSFLPGLLRGLNVNASYTRTTVSQRHPDTSPHVVAGSLGYGYGRYTLRFGAVWRSDTPTTTTVTRFMRHKTTCDLSGAVQITKRATLFFQCRRLFNDSDEIYEGVNAEHDRAVLQMYENYGTNWVFGVKGTF